jgi:archaellum component FlaC
METLKLRNIYAKKISSSLDEVLKKINLLNNIDNNIILNNNNLKGGADVAAGLPTNTGELDAFIANPANNQFQRDDFFFSDPDCSDLQTHRDNISARINENIKIYENIMTKIRDVIEGLQNTNPANEQVIANLRKSLQNCRDCKQNYSKYLTDVNRYMTQNNFQMNNTLNSLNTDLALGLELPTDELEPIGQSRINFRNVDNRLVNVQNNDIRINPDERGQAIVQLGQPQRNELI